VAQRFTAAINSFPKAEEAALSGKPFRATSRRVPYSFAFLANEWEHLDSQLQFVILSEAKDLLFACVTSTSGNGLFIGRVARAFDLAGVTNTVGAQFLRVLGNPGTDGTLQFSTSGK
jgi:hypothetical protein